jgi:hypothetical protein
LETVEEGQGGSAFYRAWKGGEPSGDDGLWSELKTSVIRRQGGENEEEKAGMRKGLGAGWLFFTGGRRGSWTGGTGRRQRDESRVVTSTSIEVGEDKSGPARPLGPEGDVGWYEIKTKEIRGIGLGSKRTRAKMENGLQDLVFKLIQGFEFKSKILNFFKFKLLTGFK